MNFLINRFFETNCIQSVINFEISIIFVIFQVLLIIIQKSIFLIKYYGIKLMLL